MKTIFLISPYWKESHRWMVSSYKMAKLWQAMGYKVVAICLHTNEGIIEQTDTLTVYGVKDVFLPDPFNFGISFNFYRQVLKRIKEYNPDIVIINKIMFWTSWSIFLLRLKGIKPLVLTDALVGVTWWPRNWYMKVLAFLGAHSAGWLTMLLARKLVFFHPQPVNVLRRMFVQKKSIVIPTGIDVQTFNFSIPSHVNNEPIVITFLGRLESSKGVDDLCEALTPLKKQYNNIHIQIVGLCDKEHSLVKEFSEYITFTGLRDDVKDILSKTDIFVLPSHGEGLSNALMEAMSSGCACVVSTVGGNPFLVEHNVSGLTIKAGDVTALRKSVETLIIHTDMREQYARAAHKRITEHFDWSIVSQKYANLFAIL